MLGSTTPTAGTAYSALVDGLNQPRQPAHAIIRVETQPIRYRTDGTAPTSSEGVLYDAGTIIVIEDSPDVIRKAKIIETTASAQITVEYYY